MSVEDFQKHKKEKFMDDNKYRISDILMMIRDQDSIPENESFTLDNLKGIQAFKTYIDETIHSNYAILQNRPGERDIYTTMFIVKNRDTFVSCVRELVFNLSPDMKFRIAKLVFPKCIQFYEDKDGGKAYYLYDYQKGVIECK